MNGEAGAPECTQCTADSSTAAKGATTITECLCNVGHSGDIVDAESECTACCLATYKGEVGPGECTACPGAGVTTAETGSTVVTECLCIAGYSGDIIDTDSECTSCAEGSWNGEVGPGACTNCPTDASTAAEGATEITECLCPAGFTGNIAIPTDLCTGARPRESCCCAVPTSPHLVSDPSAQVCVLCVCCLAGGDVAGVQCTKPDAPEHGTVTGGNGKYPTAQATFSCDAGYHLAPPGKSVVKCGTDGRYDSPPTCRACTAIAHCKPGSLQCQTNADQVCTSCRPGWTNDQQCGGECSTQVATTRTISSRNAAHPLSVSHRPKLAVHAVG